MSSAGPMCDSCHTPIAESDLRCPACFAYEAPEPMCVWCPVCERTGEGREPTLELFVRASAQGAWARLHCMTCDRDGHERELLAARHGGRGLAWSGVLVDGTAALEADAKRAAAYRQATGK